MARKAKSDQAKRKSRAVEEQAADAAASALGFAMHDAFDADPVEAAGKLGHLAGLCDRAADHMALAHNLLAAHTGHADTAIEHLDAALGCLREIVAEGEKETPKSAKPSRRKSA